MEKLKAKKILNLLDNYIKNPETELEYSTNFELLVAVILSAQCTDKRVNMVTKELFKEFNTPWDFANMPLGVLEEKIHACGFYHNKAKNILSMSSDLLKRFGGEVPSNQEDLVSLAGVGRKTANVVLGEHFKKDAIAVDTHVLRVSNRLGFAKTDNPLKCEKALNNLFEKKDWSKIHLQMVLFGRYICKSQSPQCDRCKFYNICQSKDKKKLLDFAD